MKALDAHELADYPMFPLGTPLLPGAALPMQIFEPRYIEMLRRQRRDPDRTRPEFGIVMIERGTETGGNEDRATVACRSVALNLEVTANGVIRFAALGVERLRVVNWLDDDPYPRAEVQRWPDVPGPRVPASTVEEIAQMISEVHSIANELGDTITALSAAADLDSEFALFQLAAAAPIGPLDRYRVLAAPSQDERARALLAALEDARSVLKFRQIC